MKFESKHLELLMAIKNGDNKLVETFLNGSIDIHYISSDSNWTLLNYAVEHSNLAVIKMLLGNGIDINFQGDGKGSWPAIHHAIESAIDFACQSEEELDTEIIEYLLKFKPDLLIKDFSGCTALDYAQGDKLLKLLGT